MIVYIYDDNFKFKYAKKVRSGIIYNNSTVEPVDLSTYNTDKYDITFDKESNKWIYTLKQDTFSDNQDNTELTETQLLLNQKYLQLNNLKRKKDTYYNAELTATLLNIENNLATKRLELVAKIAKLESEIEELNNGQN